MERKKVGTLVTARSSGSSYLNRVELQNGCLSRAHSSTFIPSTLGGSCMDSETGGINTDKLHHNLDLAINAYLSRVDGCPFGKTVNHLYKGADSSLQQLRREKLLVFLKGSKKKREALRQAEPEVYATFQKVWDI